MSSSLPWQCPFPIHHIMSSHLQLLSPYPWQLWMPLMQHLFEGSYSCALLFAKCVVNSRVATKSGMCLHWGAHGLRHLVSSDPNVWTSNDPLTFWQVTNCGGMGGGRRRTLRAASEHLFLELLHVGLEGLYSSLRYPIGWWMVRSCVYILIPNAIARPSLSSWEYRFSAGFRERLA